MGGAAQTKAMKKVAGKLRLELAQYRELAAFSQFASDLDESTKKVLDKGKVLTEILKQADFQPLPFQYEVIVIYAATNGYFASVPVEKVQQRSKDLLAYMHKMHKGILDTIEKTATMDDETIAKLKNALEEFNRVEKA